MDAGAGKGIPHISEVLRHDKREPSSSLFYDSF